MFKPISILICLVWLGTVQVSYADQVEDERDALGLEFGSDDWVDDEDLQQAYSLRELFRNQAIAAGEDDPPYWTYDHDYAAIPQDFVPWWQLPAMSAMGERSQPTKETPESLLLRAISHSSQIRVFSDIPVIRETAELEAKGRFDPTVYVDGRLNDLDDPVGNTLTTGGPDRFLEDEWLTTLGIKKTFISGTKIDLSQRWGNLNNNSEFLVPKDQANTRIAITITQPLLNGFGVKYNRGVIDVARIDGSVAVEEFRRQVESHLLSVLQAYWALYQERATLLQRRELVKRGQAVVRQMEGRLGHDVDQAQLSRAQSKLSLWRSHITRAETSVRDAESRILSLVNDPALQLSETFEIIPATAPTLADNDISTEVAMSLALNNRPEIEQVFRQIKAASIREYMSHRELQPTLDLFAQYYREGLAGNDDLGNAYDNQWDDGDGSWVVGLVFDYPIGNRAAKARSIRRQAETRQVNEQLRTTLETIRLELSVNTREVKTSRMELRAKYDAMQAARDEVRVINEREGVDVGPGGVSYLERLLGALERLTLSEHEFLTSQIVYNVALLNLDKGTGTLLKLHDIEPRRDDSGDIPQYRLEQIED